MRHISQWFATDHEKRSAEDFDGEVPWYQDAYEFNGQRMRLLIGDIVASGEHDFGGHHGVEFGVELHLWANVSEFDRDYPPRERYDDHYFSVILWRWGIYFAWRGRRRAS